MSQTYKQVKVNLLPEDYDRLKQIATEKELSLAQLFRRKVRASIPDARRRNQDQARLDLLFELHKIGVNINQIAKHCNEEKAVDRQVLFALAEIEKQMKRAIDDCASRKRQ